MKEIEEYLESPEVKGLAKATRDLYAHALQHVERFIRESDLTPKFCHLSDLEWFCQQALPEFVKTLESNGLSGNTIQQYLTCTKIFLKWAGHPVDFTYKIPNADRQANKRKHLDRWFTEEEVDKCLAYNFPGYPPREQAAYIAIVRLLYETGARVGEIANIRPGDVNLEEGYITIQGKTEPRPVFFSPLTYSQLKSIMIGSLKQGNLLSATMDPEGGIEAKYDVHNVRLFPDVAKIKTVISEMLKDLGLKNGKDGRGPHTFRHFTATFLFYEGEMRIEDIAYLLGDKVETIRERYLHPTPMMLRRRVAKAMGWGEALEVKWVNFACQAKVIRGD